MKNAFDTPIGEYKMSIPEILPEINENIQEFDIPETLARYCGRNIYFWPTLGKAKTFFCGKASCQREICQAMFRAKRVRLINALVSEYGLTKFFTLTVTRDMLLKEAWQEMPHIWSLMRKRLRRLSKDFLFVAVLEAHKDGYPHIHGFTNTYIEKHDLTDMWVACGGGKMTWIEKVTDDIGEYVSKQLGVGKYLSKQNLCLAKSRVGKQHTFWRSLNMKAQFELETPQEKCVLLQGNYVDNEGNPLYDIVKDDDIYRVQLR